MSWKTFATLLVFATAWCVANPVVGDDAVRDLSWFLERMRDVRYLPELENSHTAMASTWDRSGRNFDNTDFKGFVFPKLGLVDPRRPDSPAIKEARNVLLDVDGPGCLHRFFVGMLRKEHARTRIQIFLDHSKKPLFDMSILEFFDDQNGPLPYPLVFHKSYPGTLFPIPYAEHCLVQLVNPDFGKPDFNPSAWNNYWQLTYTTYPSDTKVKTLTWPPSDSQKQQIDETCKAWLKAESTPPEMPSKPSFEKTFALPASQSQQMELKGCGVIRQMRIAVEPATPEVLKGLRLQWRWDGAKEPSVDVPVGYFFGYAHTGHGKRANSAAAVLDRRPGGSTEYSCNFNSLLLGVTDTEAYACFPMPFADGVVLRLENRSSTPIEMVRVRLDVEPRDDLPSNWGRFQATWSEERAASDTTPRFGPMSVPGKVVLFHHGRGKYVGVMLHVDWSLPLDQWWGEGDWLIWTDEQGWPPSYHGTGSEEYFNSGWGQFDRKAVSGFVAVRPGHPMVYSFHLNDAFQFQRNVLVVEEQMGAGQDAVKHIRQHHPTWSSTAYWYVK
ncbi:MAG: DUF2961 domain-containing protein [Pirellulales bacterium]|nr:DUF2961 domain-containing protein [Pirellulales bacterium]